MGIGEPYISGDWLVRSGSEAEFVDRWTKFVGSGMEAPGARSFVLIQDVDTPGHFISFGRWESQDAVDAWRSTPEFANLMANCRALCEEFKAGRGYKLAAAVPSA